MVVAGEDLQLAAVDAAARVDPAGVRLGHRGHAGLVGGGRLLRGPGHDGDGAVPGTPRGTGDDPAPGDE